MEVFYGRCKKRSLEDLLCSLGDSVRFVTSGSVPPALPGLTIKKDRPDRDTGVGSRCETHDRPGRAAPYGRGEKTILDANVRRVWQLDPKQFDLENREWDDHLATIVDVVRNDLGIAQKVKAEPYKLLIYEKGSFFAPHRDTEKSSRMFATLVICLPSRHEGGDARRPPRGTNQNDQLRQEGKRIQNAICRFLC